MAGCRGESPDDPTPVPLPVISLDTSEKQLIITEQASCTVRIFDQPTRLQLWSWSPNDSPETASRIDWFKYSDEAKPVMDASCLLITASGGGAVLLRISDRKVLFMAKPEGNPHSAEILPDGNIATCSSDGYILIYGRGGSDVYVKDYLSKTNLAGVHSVVWDKKRDGLWAIGDNLLIRYSYSEGKLSPVRTISLPSPWGHDLIPVYGKDEMMFTTGSNVYNFNPETGAISSVVGAPCVNNVKSLSTGPDGFITTCTIPTESWYTPEVLGLYTGIRAFYLAGGQIYKARWRLDNSFSY